MQLRSNRAKLFLTLAATLTALSLLTSAMAQPDSGRLEEIIVPAPSLAGNLLGDPTQQPAFVYLPPGYDSGSDRYPTLYLLHGVLDSPSVWVEPAYQGMTIQSTMDRLIAEGKVEPMIVVMPSGKNAYGASAYMNTAVAGNWGDYIARDVVKYIDQTFRTIPKAGSRAVTGHSMGGFGAIRLAMLHPDIFSVAWGMNPCCLCCMGMETPSDLSFWKRMEAFESPQEMWEELEEKGDPWPLIIAGMSTVLSPDPEDPPLYFDPPYRVDEDQVVATGALDRWESQLPLAQVGDYIHNLKRLKGLAFDSAFNDEFVHIPRSAEAFSELLSALRVPHLFEVYAGDHRNRMSERLPQRILPWISARLAE